MARFGSRSYVIQAPNFEKLKDVLPRFLDEYRTIPRQRGGQ